MSKKFKNLIIMKMLKLLSLITVFACIFYANNLFGQGAYIKVSTGYSFAVSAQNIDGFNNSTEVYSSSYSGSSQESCTEEQVDVSLGKGLNFDGAFGYMFNKNLAAELGFSYLLGAESEARSEYEYTYRGYYDNISYHSLTDYTLSSNMLRITPAVIISSGLVGINPYAKFGLVIGKGTIHYDYEENDDDNIYKYKEEWNGGLSMGFNTAVGANYALGGNILLFGEISMINMSYAPTNGEVTEASYNGEDNLSDMTTNEKETEFVDEYSYSDSSSPDGLPNKELKQNLPFGSLGLIFGIKIGF